MGARRIMQGYGLLLFCITLLGSWCYANNMAMYALVSAAHATTLRINT